MHLKFEISKLGLIVFVMFTSLNLISAQENYQIDLLRKHKIKAIEFFNFKIEDGKILPDFNMNVKAEFNSMGYVFNTYIYDSLTLRMRYEKVYREDTILVATNDFRGVENVLTGGNVIRYENGKRLSEIYYKGDEKKVETYFSYNKKGLLSKKIKKVKDGRTFKFKFEYNSNNQLVKTENQKKKRWKRYYDKYGRHISTYLIEKNENERNNYKVEYLGEADQKIKEVIKYYGNVFIIGEGGVLKMKNGDVLKKEFYYHENGLIDYVKQSLNGELDAIKKYKYIQ